VLARARDVDGDVIVDFGNGEDVILADVTVASLHADDFLFAWHPRSSSSRTATPGRTAGRCFF
jgi:hypothetical protein